MTVPELIAECQARGIVLAPVLEIDGNVPPELAAELESQSDAIVFHLLRPNVRPVRLPDGFRPAVAYDRDMKRTVVPSGKPLPWDCVLWHHDGEVYFHPGPANVMGWTVEK